MSYLVSPPPHIRTPMSTKRIMLDVLIALLPASIAGIVLFGWQAAVVLGISVVSAAATELVWQLIAKKFRKRPKEAFLACLREFDFTSLVTGLILGLSLPALAEAWYAPLLGSVFAVGAVKMLFGGTGKNVVNPAAAGRVFLFLSFAVMMRYPAPNFGAIASSDLSSLTAGATQLATALQGEPTLSALDLFLGTGVAGCIGETCKLAVLVGYIYLSARGIVKWYLPLLCVCPAVLFGMLLEWEFSFLLMAQLGLSGGLLFGAVFMATDYVTSPKSRLANIVYFVLLGLLIGGLRKAAGIEVFSFCLLLMNFTVFLIDPIFKPRPFGKTKKEGNK